MKLSPLIFLFCTSALLPSLVNAHSEHEKARFVAAEGKDIGKCDNALRPCKSIGYAVQQANKGDKVLVASGNYKINSSEDIFYLKSNVVPIIGGYNRFDHFQNQSPDTNVTVISGIPLDVAPQLRQKGFTVISDGKSFIQDKKLQQKLAAYQQLSQSQSNVACVDGKAGEFECNKVDLYAHIALSEFSSSPSSANDIWGHVDLNTMREYALIGLNNGVAVVDVTTPSAPKEIGTISGTSSLWRDVKVYQYFDKTLNAWQAYAYATIDSKPDHVTIIDLNNLPESVSLVEKNTSVATAHNVYITNVDPTLNIAQAGMTPTLQLTGANKFGGAFHHYSLENPRTLKDIGASGAGYTHDGASLIVKDERANDCVAKTAPCTVFVDFNEKEVKLWDMTDPANTSLLGVGQYFDVSQNFQYVHSGWASEDQQYVFVHDEFDEKDAGINSTVRVFSIADLKNPALVGKWTGPTRAIDHNGFVRGNRYYLSNYERGFTILDISDPTKPTDIAFFDTFTPSNNANYGGAWGGYPYLPSGTILVSDIDSGLYVLKDNATESSQGNLHFTSQTINSKQGATLSIPVVRSGVDAQASDVSVAYEIIPGSADQQDYVDTKGFLTWLENDTNTKTINIEIKPDNGDEYQESFFVRLYNPQNGATLSSPSYIKVQLEGLVDSGAIQFTSEQITVNENGGQLEIPVSRIGATHSTATVIWHLISGSATIGSDVEQASGQLTWADGDQENKTIFINIIDDANGETTETFRVELSAVDNTRLGTKSITVNIADDDTNHAPVVNLGENFETNAGQTVSLIGSASDAENDEITYQWTQTLGTSVTIDNANSATASFVAPQVAGQLTFELTATDSKGAASSASISISVVVPTPEPEQPAQPTKSSGGGAIAWLLMIIGFITRFRAKK